MEEIWYTLHLPCDDTKVQAILDDLLVLNQHEESCLTDGDGDPDSQPAIHDGRLMVNSSQPYDGEAFVWPPHDEDFDDDHPTSWFKFSNYPDAFIPMFAAMICVRHHMGDHFTFSNPYPFHEGLWLQAVNLYRKQFPHRDIPAFFKSSPQMPNDGSWSPATDPGYYARYPVISLNEARVGKNSAMAMIEHEPHNPLGYRKLANLAMRSIVTLAQDAGLNFYGYDDAVFALEDYYPDSADHINSAYSAAQHLEAYANGRIPMLESTAATVPVAAYVVDFFTRTPNHLYSIADSIHELITDDEEQNRRLLLELVQRSVNAISRLGMDPWHFEDPVAPTPEGIHDPAYDSFMAVISKTGLGESHNPPYVLQCLREIHKAAQGDTTNFRIERLDFRIAVCQAFLATTASPSVTHLPELHHDAATARAAG